MKLTLASDSRPCVVAAEGEFKRNQHEVSDPLRSLIGSLHARTVVLNLRRVTSFDGSGLAWLLAARDAVTQAHGELILLAVPASMRRALALVGGIGLFRMVDTLAAVREPVPVEAA